jgi:hypothetical protein
MGMLLVLLSSHIFQRHRASARVRWNDFFLLPELIQARDELRYGIEVDIKIPAHCPILAFVIIFVTKLGKARSAPVFFYFHKITR